MIRVKNPNSVPSIVGSVGEREGEGEGEGGMERESQPASSGLMKVQMNVQSLFKLVRNKIYIHVFYCDKNS